MDKRKGRTIKSERTSTRLQHSLDYLFDYYYQAKKSEGRAENTLKTYVQNYNYFCEFLDKHKIIRDIRNINVEVGRDYIIWLRDEKRRFSDNCNVPESVRTVGLLPKSINIRIKIFFVYLPPSASHASITFLNAFFSALVILCGHLSIVVRYNGVWPCLTR
ncbi:integrase/recombinase XerD [Paenibacillus polysaccharolyticus]|uniref:Integrase/recombinase XerD n=1 Tax=Paenibacillus polysaccharolyticus TaxID=582692 RepID=A0A1G5IB30_9BACL|nr:integrase/recombinase XerD [Paenibacillus polysaccharolyticus]